MGFAKWLTAKKCQILGHEVVKGEKCPVTGIIKLTCTLCGEDNMPKHTSEGRFK